VRDFSRRTFERPIFLRLQYRGLKYGADEHDARWLAHLLRVGSLHEGYTYPREYRFVTGCPPKVILQRHAYCSTPPEAAALQHGDLTPILLTRYVS